MSDSPISLSDPLGGHDGILKLIKTFYVDVRQHAVLGPSIHDWPAHLEQIADFWALQCGGPTRYRIGGGTFPTLAGSSPDAWRGLATLGPRGSVWTAVPSARF